MTVFAVCVFVAGAAAASPSLYWSTVGSSSDGLRDDHGSSGAIGATPLDQPTVGTPVVASAGSQPEGLIVHDGFVYWTARSSEDELAGNGRGDEEHARRIYRAPADGSGSRQVIPTDDCASPTILAIGAGQLYWIDSRADAIGFKPLSLAGVSDDGSHHHHDDDCGVVPLKGGSAGLWADDSGIYWTAAGSGISHADPFGGRVTRLIADSSVTSQTSLTGFGGSLYWTAPADGGTIKTASTAGGGVMPFRLAGSGVPTDLAADGTFLYWVRDNGKGISRIGTDGTNVQVDYYPSTTGFGSNGRTGVAVDPGAQPPPRATLTVDMVGSGRAGGIVASVDDNAIACPTVCSASFEVGTVVHLVAAAGLGSGTTLTGLGLPDGVSGSCSVEQGTCEVRVDRDTTLTATFGGAPPGAPVPLSVAFDGDGAGVVTGGTSFATTPFQCAKRSAPCSESVPGSALVTLTATPLIGARFVSWTGTPAGSTCAGSDPTCTFSIEVATRVVATFTQVVTPPVTTAVVSVQVNEGGGAVASDPPFGINCPDACSAEFPIGTEVTLNATPAPGKVLSSWSGESCGTADTCTFSVARDTKVQALFVDVKPPPGPDPAPTPDPTPAPAPAPAVDTAPLELIKDGTPLGWVYSDPAAIACNLSCSATFDVGTAVTLRAKEAPSADFLGWGENCRGAALTCRVQMQGARRVVARFNRVGQLTLTRLKVSTRAVVVSARPSAARSSTAQRGSALITYRVSENAAVTLTFTRVWPRGGRPQTLRLRFRDGRKGGKPGLNTVRFTGRIGKTAMSRGVWRMTATAYDGTTTARAELPSKPIYFRIARPGESLPRWK